MEAATAAQAREQHVPAGSTGSGANSHLFNFTSITANKAGMGADKKLVADFVFERSKGSQYTQHQLDLDAKQRAKTQAVALELQALEARLTPAEKQREKKLADEALEELEKHRDLSRTFCVVDMDMFYAAVEIRDRPELAAKPVAVGGLGMITTANYVARLYGVRSAMPGFIAVELVRNPHLVGSKMPPDELIFIRPDFAKYTQASFEGREVFREYDANFGAYSLDEAYLDLTDYLTEHGGPDSADEVVQELRQRVKERTRGLTCSAGIGPNTMLAKIASEDNKPDGQTRVRADRDAILEYVHRLPVRRVPGCGKVLEHQLAALLQVQTCGELRAAAHLVRRAFEARPKTCTFLLRACLGLGSDELAEEDGHEVGSVGRKSLSTERTFQAESRLPELEMKLKELCRQVAEEMGSCVPPLAARVIALKTKAANFEVRNRQVSCPRPVGFRSDFGSIAVCKRPIGPGCSLAKGTMPLAAPREADSQEVAKFEEEVERVSQELHALLLPLLIEQLPCTLRLMGVRASSFRDQKAVLHRGQQQLTKFFESKSGGGKPSEKPGGDRAVIDLDESDDEHHTSSFTCCPVCGLQVLVVDADRHVNAHYDAPAVRDAVLAPLDKSASRPKPTTLQHFLGSGERVSSSAKKCRTT